jgi:serine/threonine protein phosphatase PrpC
MRVAAWGATDPGRRRSRNEDAFGILEADGVLVVADGMGGHRGGSVASKMAVDGLLSVFRGVGKDYASALDAMRGDRRRVGTTEPMFKLDDALADTGPMHAEEVGLQDANQASAATLLHMAVRQAGAAIYLASRTDTELHGMGTTVTAALIDGERAHLAHAGDSRCYLWRAGVIKQVTDDHSWIAEQVRVGALTEREAKQSRFRHVITRSLGFERHVDVEVRTVPVRHGDRLLLCSDGLSGLVADSDLAELLAGADLPAIPEKLIALANERGGDDNITAVVAELRSVVSP